MKWIPYLLLAVPGLSQFWLKQYGAAVALFTLFVCGANSLFMSMLWSGPATANLLWWSGLLAVCLSWFLAMTSTMRALWWSESPERTNQVDDLCKRSWCHMLAGEYTQALSRIAAAKRLGVPSAKVDLLFLEALCHSRLGNDRQAKRMFKWTQRLDEDEKWHFAIGCELKRTEPELQAALSPQDEQQRENPPLATHRSDTLVATEQAIVNQGVDPSEF